MKKHVDYLDGMDMDQFKHIPEISCYNHNYHIGIKRKFCHDLLFAKSDDDQTTEWSVLENGSFVLIGYSHINDEKLIK